MATYTPNYNLPKYEEEDIPNLLDEYNQAMDLIDTGIKQANDTGINASTSAGNAASAAESAKETANSAASAASAANEAASKAQSAADAAASALNGKAPTNHASSGTTYGVGSVSNYGHVKLYSTVGVQTDGSVTGKAVSDYVTAALEQVSNDWQSVDFSVGIPGYDNPSTGTAIYNKSLNLIKIMMGITQTIGTQQIPANSVLGTIPSSIPRPAADRTLRGYMIVSVQAPAASSQYTFAVTRDLIYKTNGELTIVEGIGLPDGQTSGWLEISTVQALLYCGNWGGGF